MISYVILIATLKEEKRMKSLKQWLMLLLASLMILGVATGCSNDDATNEDDTNTEETDTEQTEDTNTEDAEQTEDTEEEGQ
ncbi:hypothetical protein CD798_06440 [Bacillaceae bacterium SAOS 7]|nr:hypothetical protein CD798_06440 [Bacillaceae bacterium SAOS 7]